MASLKAACQGDIFCKTRNKTQPTVPFVLLLYPTQPLTLHELHPTVPGIVQNLLLPVAECTQLHMKMDNVGPAVCLPLWKGTALNGQQDDK